MRVYIFDRKMLNQIGSLHVGQLSALTTLILNWTDYGFSFAIADPKEDSIEFFMKNFIGQPQQCEKFIETIIHESLHLSLHCDLKIPSPRKESNRLYVAYETVVETLADMSTYDSLDEVHYRHWRNCGSQMEIIDFEAFQQRLIQFLKV